MKWKALVPGALLALLPSISNATLMVMVDGIVGPGKQAPYSGWFTADSFSWAHDRVNPTNPFGLTVSMKQFGIGFASIVQAAFSGASPKKVIIDVLTAGAQDQLMVISRLTCEEAQVRNSSTSGPGDNRPQVQFEFGCARFVWENFEMDRTGAIISAGKGSWNFKTNTP